ncbi:MAG: LysR family transcriptional regulator [Pseudomonadales bacterium]
MFEFRRLKHFIAVAEELHVGRAAVRLHISQPPLSRSIHQLEAFLGVQLFVRTPQGVELTNEGEVFLKEARKILQMVERACEFTAQAQRGEIGRLIIGYYGSAIFNVLPRLMAAFKLRYPSAALSIHNMNKSEQIQALRDHSIHIGFIRYVNDEPDITTETIMREPIHVAVPANHPLAEKESMGELSTKPMMVFPRSPRPSFVDQVISLCHKSGFVPNIVQEADDAETCIALVSTGLGISMVPASLSNLRIPGVVYRPLSEEMLMTELSCVYLADRNAPVLDAFLGCVKDIESLF